MSQLLHLNQKTLLFSVSALMILAIVLVIASALSPVLASATAPNAPELISNGQVAAIQGGNDLLLLLGDRNLTLFLPYIHH